MEISRNLSLWEQMQTILLTASGKLLLLGYTNSHPLTPECYSIMLPFWFLPSSKSQCLKETWHLQFQKAHAICEWSWFTENSSSPPWRNYLSDKFMLLEHKPICGQQFNQMYKLHFLLQILTLLPLHCDTPVYCNCTINLCETHCLSAVKVVQKPQVMESNPELWAKKAAQHAAFSHLSGLGSSYIEVASKSFHTSFFKI